MKESKQLVRKVRADFDKTKEYNVNVVNCTAEEKEAVQQAFFDVDIWWVKGDNSFQYLDAAMYTNTLSNGRVTGGCMFASSTERSNMYAKEFLALVYEPTEQEHVQTELKKMKLIDLLNDNDIKWPEGASGVVQDGDCFLKFYIGEKPVIHNIGVWLTDTLAVDPVYLNETASDYRTAIITKQDWENRKVDKKPMFADIKIGDKVWDTRKGWGVVSRVSPSHTYTIDVEFGQDYSTYNQDGYFNLNDVNPSLYWDEIKLEAPPKPLPALEVDTKVNVWLPNNGVKICRHFSHYDEDGFLYVFADGRTSFTSDGTTHQYDNWEIA